LLRLQSGLNTINITIYDKSDGQYGWAHPAYFFIGTGLSLATSAPGPAGSLLPHLLVCL
jgi:hypothetical protein